MASEATAYKVPEGGYGENMQRIDIYARTVGGGDESQRIGFLMVRKDFYDALPAAQKTAVNAVTLDGLINTLATYFTLTVV